MAHDVKTTANPQAVWLCRHGNQAEWFPEPPRLMTLHELRRRFPRVDTHDQSMLTPAYPENGTSTMELAGDTSHLHNGAHHANRFA